MFWRKNKLTKKDHWFLCCLVMQSLQQLELESPHCKMEYIKEHEDSKKYHQELLEKLKSL
jgi:hypothetical protein